MKKNLTGMVVATSLSKALKKVEEEEGGADCIDRADVYRVGYLDDCYKDGAEIFWDKDDLANLFNTIDEHWNNND